MATLIRCPRCKSETDASSAKPGSVIKCVHCRGDMRVPDAPKAAGGPATSGGRQSVLFRRMTNATVPGQRGRGAVTSGAERGASGRGTDMSGIYTGLGIVAIIGIIVAIGLVMKGKGTPETPVKPRKEVAGPRTPIPPPAPPAPPPVVEPAKPPNVTAAAHWEPDAMSFVLAGVRPIQTEAAAEKDAIHFIQKRDSARINGSPFRYLPFVINSLVTEDRDLARAAFNVLYDFCVHRELKFEDGKYPIDVSKVNNAEYRGYMFQHWTRWWSENASKLPDAPKNLEIIEKLDWVAHVREMQGGAYHDESTPQGIAFRKIKNLGRGAWPKLADLVDHDDLSIGQTASNVLSELTGHKMSRPTEVTRAEVKNAWLTWIRQN